MVVEEERVKGRSLNTSCWRSNVIATLVETSDNNNWRLSTRKYSYTARVSDMDSATLKATTDQLNKEHQKLVFNIVQKCLCW